MHRTGVLADITLPYLYTCSCSCTCNCSVPAPAPVPEDTPVFVLVAVRVHVTMHVPAAVFVALPVLATTPVPAPVPAPVLAPAPLPVPETVVAPVSAPVPHYLALACSLGGHPNPRTNGGLNWGSNSSRLPPCAPPSLPRLLQAPWQAHVLFSLCPPSLNRAPAPRQLQELFDSHPEWCLEYIEEMMSHEVTGRASRLNQSMNQSINKSIHLSIHQ